jgi:hypothetical protein
VSERKSSKVRALQALVGEWDIEATHPLVPGVTVSGKAIFEWIDGERFLLMKSWNDHPDFPNATSILGDTSTERADAGEGPDDPLRMFYFDSRGVHRVYDIRLTSKTWEWSLDAEGFWQRFTGTFNDGGNTISGQGELCRDGKTWEPDIRMSYRRVR